MLRSTISKGRCNHAWAEIFRRLMASKLIDADFEDRLLRAHWLMSYHPALSNWAGSKSVKETLI